MNFKGKTEVFLLWLLLLILLSCHPDFGGGRCHPEGLLVDGVKDIIVSPEREGLSLTTLYVKDIYRGSDVVTERAELRFYSVDSSQMHVEKSYSLYPSTFTDVYDSFSGLCIYPVEGTANAFLFMARFFSESITNGETFYFLNENGKFIKVKGGIFNSVFRFDEGYYFSIVSLFYWAPLNRYGWIKYGRDSYSIEVSNGRLPGFFEAYPYTSVYYPRIFLRDKDLDLSRLFIFEGGEIIKDSNMIYFQGSDSFNPDYLYRYPSLARNIDSYLFVGNVEFDKYSMNVTDVRYKRFENPETFTTIIGMDYFKGTGLVVYTREFTKDILSEAPVRDKVMVLDPENLKTLFSKEISYNTYSSESYFHIPLLIHPESEPFHSVAFDRKNRRVISVLGKRIAILDLASLKTEILELPSPWVCDGGDTGVWVDGNGHIWIVARDVNSDKAKEKVEIKPCVFLLVIRFRYGVLRIEENNGNYSVKVVGELK